MPQWTRAACVADCPPGTSLEVAVNGRIIALYNVEGQVFALDGICSHQGGPLGKGAVRGCVVTCPWHGWQYDVRTGQHQAIPSLRQPALPVKIEEGEIWVDLAAG